MIFPRFSRRALRVIITVFPLAGLFVWVAIRSGPLATVPVTVETVELRSITPELFGIGTTEARYTYRIGPTVPGRLQALHVDVGDYVKKNALLGEMDPVDLEERIAAQQASIQQAQAVLRQAEAKKAFTEDQVSRYEKLLLNKATSDELVQIKHQELLIASEEFASAQSELDRRKKESKALHTQHRHLRLVAPSDGLVVGREAEPGSTVIAGQPVIELIDPAKLWINARFDQISAQGLTAGLAAEIKLRSQSERTYSARILRVEPKADAITEEILAKVVFDPLPETLPPLGELAEITVRLNSLSPAPTIPNAAIHYHKGQRGVWRIIEEDIIFTPLKLGRFDSDGYTQVEEGLKANDSIIVYTEKPLKAHSRVRIVETLPLLAP